MDQAGQFPAGSHAQVATPAGRVNAVFIAEMSMLSFHLDLAFSQEQDLLLLSVHCMTVLFNESFCPQTTGCVTGLLYLQRFACSSAQGWLGSGNS